MMAPPQRRHRATRRVVFFLVAVSLGMVGFAYALVPIYEVFCEYTGLDTRSGVLSEREASDFQPADREVLMELDSNLDSQLPWRFSPVTRKLRLRLGEVSEFVYEVRNTSGRAWIGQAVPSVTPSQAAPYVKKLQCFCFSPVELQAGERKLLPVRMVISPELPERFSELTLSYTFYPSKPAPQQGGKYPGSSGKGES